MSTPEPITDLSGYYVVWRTQQFGLSVLGRIIAERPSGHCLIDRETGGEALEIWSFKRLSDAKLFREYADAVCWIDRQNDEDLVGA